MIEVLIYNSYWSLSRIMTEYTVTAFFANNVTCDNPIPFVLTNHIYTHRPSYIYTGIKIWTVEFLLNLRYTGCLKKKK